MLKVTSKITLTSYQNVPEKIMINTLLVTFDEVNLYTNILTYR